MTHPLSAENRFRRALPTWTVTVTSGADAAVVATKAGEAGKRHYVTHVSAKWNGVPTGFPNGRPSVILFSGTTVKMDWNTTEKGWKARFSAPVEIALGEAAKLQLNMGGAGVSGRVNISGFTL